MTAFYLDRALLDAPKRTARASEIEIQEISRGAVVSLQGDHVEKVILVVGGLLRLTRISVDGREVSLAYLIGGDVLTTDTVCPYQAIAEAQTLIALVPWDVFAELRTKNQAFSARIDRSLRRRASLLEQRAEIAHRSARVRVANALLEISTHLRAPPLLPRTTTHQVIGTFASTIREVVSVELATLASRGAVAKRNRLMTLDRQRLREFVQAPKPRKLRK